MIANECVCCTLLKQVLGCVRDEVYKKAGGEMTKFYKLFIALLLAFLLTPLSLPAQSSSDKFDFLLILTQQDMDMDWWYSVPSQFDPRVAPVEGVTKKEYFKILPIYNNYGVSDDDKINVTYDIEIIKPDGSSYENIKSIDGYIGETTGPYLLPSAGIVMVCFEPEDPFGEYTINVTAYDHVKGQQASKSKKLVLKPFDLDAQEVELKEWFLNYPVRPKPSLALSAFLNSPKPFIDDKGRLLMSVLWMYKIIYETNDFLIPHTVDFYKSAATQQQKTDLIMLFHLIDKVDLLPLRDGGKKLISALQEMSIPDPYGEIETASQLDMLWAEYFATSKVEPIRQILTALKYSTHMGTLDKIKSGEVDPSSDEVKEKAYLEAVFQSALWSISSNCKQSPLVFHYCVGLYESDQLEPIEKRVLGLILKSVSEDMNEAEQES